jgi:hypothetical protein
MTVAFREAALVYLVTTTYGGVLASSRAVIAWEKRAEISGVS